MKVFPVLTGPDRKDAASGDRLLIGDVANLLQVGEFQVLQLAYFAWFGRDLPEERLSSLFARYMFAHEAPPWARHYARQILNRDRLGHLDTSDPRYHRYDCDYATVMPKGPRQFILAVSVIVLIMVSLFAAVSRVAPQPASLLPPFFDRRELLPRPAPPPLLPQRQDGAGDGSGSGGAAGR